MTHAPYPHRPDPGPSATVGVLIVDDQPLFLVAARRLIASTPGFESVGEAMLGERAVTLAATLRPDLVLMDVRMPGLGGLAAARRITRSAARRPSSSSPPTPRMSRPPRRRDAARWRSIEQAAPPSLQPHGALAALRGTGVDRLSDRPRPRRRPRRRSRWPGRDAAPRRRRARRRPPARRPRAPRRSRCRSRPRRARTRPRPGTSDVAAPIDSNAASRTSPLVLASKPGPPLSGSGSAPTADRTTFSSLSASLRRSSSASKWPPSLRVVRAARCRADPSP